MMKSLLVVGTCLLASCLLPQQGNSRRDGERDFDFEVGTWKTHISRLQRPLSGSTAWLEYEGTSVVRKVWRGRANTVELEVDGPGGGHIQGVSLRLYNPQSRQWSLNFVNSATGILSVPTVGEFKEGVGEFYDWEEYNGRMILVRNVWKDITPTSCRFEQAYSEDGGRTWELNWIAVDTRIEQEPAPPINEAPTDFTFEIGSWSVHHTRLLYALTDSARTIEFEGTSIARKLWNGRGILIELGSDPPSGHTEALIWRTYNPNARQWNVYVANSGVGVLSPASVGGFSNGRGEFYAMEQLDDGRTVLARTVLSNITPTSYTAEQAYSLDGGRRWVVVWTSLHRRR